MMDSVGMAGIGRKAYTLKVIGDKDITEQRVYAGKEIFIAPKPKGQDLWWCKEGEVLDGTEWISTNHDPSRAIIMPNRDLTLTVFHKFMYTPQNSAVHVVQNQLRLTNKTIRSVVSATAGDPENELSVNLTQTGGAGTYTMSVSNSSYDHNAGASSNYLTSDLFDEIANMYGSGSGASYTQVASNPKLNVEYDGSNLVIRNPKDIGYDRYTASSLYINDTKDRTLCSVISAKIRGLVKWGNYEGSGSEGPTGFSGTLNLGGTSVPLHIQYNQNSVGVIHSVWGMDVDLNRNDNSIGSNGANTITMNAIFDSASEFLAAYLKETVCVFH